VIEPSALRLLPLAVTHWLDGREREAIAYLIEENRLLRRRIGGTAPSVDRRRPAALTLGDFAVLRRSRIAADIARALAPYGKRISVEQLFAALERALYAAVADGACADPRVASVEFTDGRQRWTLSLDGSSWDCRHVSRGKGRPRRLEAKRARQLASLVTERIRQAQRVLRALARDRAEGAAARADRRAARRPGPELR
jgi:hypothetical protein